MNLRNANYVSILLLLIISATAHGDYSPETSYVWKQETDSYRIYMGVVPASEVINQPRVVDAQKKLHGVKANDVADQSHVLVVVYKKPGNARVVNATVIAEAGLTNGKKTIRPLEKMELNGRISYGNFFSIHQDEEHQVTIKIYEPTGAMYEEAVFTHVGY